MVFSFLGFLFIILFLPFTYYYAYSPTQVSYKEGFNPLYGFQNVKSYNGGKSVALSLDKYTGSGFGSKKMYNHGYFTASIKLPQRIYTGGVVVTFYTSNNQKFPHNHDEMDFEFLGHIKGQKFRLQTNFYVNSSTERGREEKYKLWFDPSQDFHRYSFLWTEKLIAYYVDDVPIRVVQNVPGGEFPSKPMALYGTIWDGSDWATDGGKAKLNLRYSPFVANYDNFVLNGCPVDHINLKPNCKGNPEFSSVPRDITPEEENKMKQFRRKYLTYSYCNDRERYPNPLPECVNY